MGSLRTGFAILVAATLWGVDAATCGTGGRRPLSLRTNTLLPASVSTSTTSLDTIPGSSLTDISTTTRSSLAIGIITSTTTSITDLRTSSDDNETIATPLSSIVDSQSPLTTSSSTPTSSLRHLTLSTELSSSTTKLSSTPVIDSTSLSGSTIVSELETLISSTTLSSCTTCQSSAYPYSSDILTTSTSSSLTVPGTTSTQKASDSYPDSLSSQSSVATSTSHASLVDPQTLSASSASHTPQSQYVASDSTTSSTTVSEDSLGTTSPPSASSASLYSTRASESAIQSQQGASASTGTSSENLVLTGTTVSGVDVSQSSSSLTVVLSSNHGDAASQGTSSITTSEGTSAAQSSSAQSRVTQSYTTTSTATSAPESSQATLSTTVSSAIGSSTTTSSTTAASSTIPSASLASAASQTTSTPLSSTSTTSPQVDPACKEDQLLLDGDFEAFSDHWTWSGLDDPHRFGINRRVISNVNSSSTSGPHTGVGYLLVNMNPSSTSYTLTYYADVPMDHAQYTVSYYWASVPAGYQSWTCSVNTVVHGTQIDELSSGPASTFNYQEHAIIFRPAESKSTTNIEITISCSSSSSIPIQLAFDDFSLQEYCSQTTPMSQTSSAVATTTSSTSDVLTLASATSGGVSLSSTSSTSTTPTSSTTSTVTSPTTPASSTQASATGSTSVAESSTSTEGSSTTGSTTLSSTISSIVESTSTASTSDTWSTTSTSDTSSTTSTTDTTSTTSTDPSSSLSTSTTDTTSTTSMSTESSSTSTTTTLTTSSGPSCPTLPILMGNPSFEDENIGLEAWTGLYSPGYPIATMSSTSTDVPRAKSGEKFLLVEVKPGDSSPNHGLKKQLFNLETSKMYQIRVSIAAVPNPDLPTYSCGAGFVIGGTPVAQSWITVKSSDAFAYTQYTGYFSPTTSTVNMELSVSCVDLNNNGRLWPGVAAIAIDDIVVTVYSAPCALSEDASSSTCGVIGRNTFTQQYGIPFNLELCAKQCTNNPKCLTFAWDADNKRCYTSTKALKDITIIAPIAGRSANVIYDRNCFQCPDCPGPAAIAATPDVNPISTSSSTTDTSPSTDASTSTLSTDSSSSTSDSSTTSSTTDSSTSETTNPMTTTSSSTTPVVNPTVESSSTTSTTSTAPLPDPTCGWEYVKNGGFEESADSDPWNYDASRDTIVSTGSGTRGPLTGSQFAVLGVTQTTTDYGRHISQTLSQIKAGKQYLWKYNWATFGWTGSGTCTLEFRVNSILVQSKSISSTNTGSYNEIAFLYTPTLDSAEIRFDIWCASQGIRSQFRAASLALDDFSVADYCPTCVATLNPNVPASECGTRAIGTTGGSAARVDAASLEICAEKCRDSTTFSCKTIAYDDSVSPGQCFLFTDTYQGIGVLGTGGGRFTISNIDCYSCAGT